MTRSEAIEIARELSKTGRKHVARSDYGRYFVCPLYEPGCEGWRHDAGYTALGALVAESI